MSRNNRSIENQPIENHPIEREELMAYLDGELATDRAVEAAAHLERCEVCQELAAELRKMSQEMMAWEIEELEADDEMPIALRAALQDVPKKSKKALKRKGWRVLLTPRGLAWAGGGVVLVLFIMMLGVSRLRYAPQTWERRREPSETYITPAPAATPQGSDSYSTNGWSLKERAQRQPGTQTYAYDSLGKLTTDGNLNGFVAANNRLGADGPKTQGALAPSQDLSTVQDAPGSTEGDEVSDRTGVPELPMIARTAGLTLVAKDFDKTRARAEEILKRHNGYIGELSVSAPSDAGRTLTATLRIPAPQLEAALAELKQLGRVENESQGGEEVTQEYVDLTARLANAQHTEKRLTEILSSRTGKLQDVLKVELEIDRVRGEIEQMVAQKKELTKRVAFATLNTTVKEEYHARLEATPPSTGSRFRNAAVDGYNTVVEGFISLGLFLLSSGPSLLIWVAILFFPVRWLWRKVRAELKKNQEQGA